MALLHRAGELGALSTYLSTYLSIYGGCMRTGAPPTPAEDARSLHASTQLPDLFYHIWIM